MFSYFLYFLQKLNVYFILKLIKTSFKIRSLYSLKLNYFYNYIQIILVQSNKYKTSIYC